MFDKVYTNVYNRNRITRYKNNQRIKGGEKKMRNKLPPKICFSFRIKEKTLEKIDKIASKKEKTSGELVREILEQYVANFG